MTHKNQTMVMLTISLWLYGIASTRAQQYSMKWGAIPKEDLSMTVYAPDTSAEALVLGNYGNVELTISADGVEYNYFHHRRVKILKRSGFRKGDVKIPYFKKEEKVLNLQVQVFTPDGKKYSLKNSEIFEENVNKDVMQRRFSAPNLVEGAVLEYRYNMTSKLIFQLPEWSFQEDIPTLRSEYQLGIPDWLHYSILMQSLNENGEKGKSETGIPGTVTLEKALTNGEPNIKRYHYAMSNMTALQEEDFITTMDDYYACIRFQLSATTFPGNGVQQVLSTWENASKSLLEEPSFGLQFLKSRNFKNASEALAPLIAGITDNDEKIFTIYTFLNRSLKWNFNYAFLTDRSLDACFEQKTGSSGELNMLFLALLKENGIEAHPLLLSTRNHGSPIELYPIMDQFNHVAVWVQYEGKWVVADIASPYYALGYPRVESLNSRAFLVRETSPRWINLPKMSGSTIKLATLKLQEDGSAVGAMQYRMQGYEAMLWREILASEDKVTVLQNKLAQTNPEVVIDNFEVQGFEDLTASLELTFGIKLADMAIFNGDVIYLNGILDPIFNENPFKLADRKFPVEIPYLISDKYFLQLELPESYTLEETQPPVRLFLPNNSGSYQFSISQVMNKLSISTELKINELQYDANGYRNLRKLFDMMLEKQKNPTVLKRKD